MIQSELDQAFRSLLNSASALRLARRTGKGENPWRGGACLVLAEAVFAWLGEDQAQLWELSFGVQVHFFVRLGDWAFDGDGISPVDELLSRWMVQGLDLERATFEPVSVAAAERSGVEFDDYARNRLVLLLQQRLPAERVTAILNQHQP